jgi:peroxiredoxin
MKTTALLVSIVSLPLLGFCNGATAAPESTPIAQLEKQTEPLGTGDSMPYFLISDAAGDGNHDLSALLTDGPVVITFYRGSWCPYCVNELNAVQKQLKGITAAGAKVLAISPEKPSETADLVEQKNLGFLFATDKDNELATKLALSFKLDAKTIKRYKQYGIDLPKSNNANVWQLPIPATYIIDSDGTIAWSFVEEDYSKRPDYRKVVKALEKLQQDG